MATKEQVEDFLKRLKEKIKVFDIIIKITLGQPNNSTICISFHLAEHPMNYPFKN